MDLSEFQSELFRTEYPNLMPDYDPDIEQYYYLRSAGRSADALSIYQYRLKPRYPHDDFRTDLLKSYRNHSPRFKQLLAIGYRILSARSLERIKRIIAFIAAKTESYNPRDVYETIKTAEEILKVLPREKYEAIASVERYQRYAEILKFHGEVMARAADLVRSYLNQSLVVAEDERRRRAREQSQARESARRRMVEADLDTYVFQKQYGYQNSVAAGADFSPEDLAKIEIPDRMRSPEDQTLAYCIKYWNLTEDAIFEKTLFLYSRKYGKKNYDAFAAIKRGRQGNFRDDEILASVMACLVSGYYYSVRGDKYLQQQWNLIKNAMKKPAIAESIGRVKPAVAENRREEKKRAAARKIAAKRAEKQKRALASAPEETPETQVKKPGARRLKRNRAETPGPVTLKPSRQNLTRPKVVKPKAAKQPPLPKPAKVKAPPRRAFKARAAIARTEGKAADVPVREESRPLPQASPVQNRSGSVSDRLRELSGRSYDLYHEQFLTHVKASIRKVLGQGKGIFYNLPEDAEALVFNFITTHYADPFMNWEESPERKALEEKGVTLESLNPIIDDCYRRLWGNAG